MRPPRSRHSKVDRKRSFGRGGASQSITGTGTRVQDVRTAQRLADEAMIQEPGHTSISAFTVIKEGFAELRVGYADYRGTEVIATFWVGEAAEGAITHYYGLWPAAANPTDQEIKDGTGAVAHAGPVAGSSGQRHVAVLNPPLPDRAEYTLHWLVTDSQPVDHTSTYGPVYYQNTPATGSLVITGDAEVGRTLTAVTTGIDDPDGLTTPVYAYSWNGAGSPTNAATYDCVAGDVGKAVMCTVTFQDNYTFDESKMASSDVVQDLPNNPATGAPSITPSGTNVGDTLTGGKGTITDPDGDTNYDATDAYRWTGGSGGPVNGQVYTLLEGDEGLTITCTAEFTDDRGFRETGLVNTYVFPANGAATGAPSITPSGNAIGDTLTAGKGTIDDPDGSTGYAGSVTYAWSNATGSPTNTDTYTLVASDAGRTITLTATFRDDRGFLESRQNTYVFTANTPATGIPGIDGTPKVGSTLTATKNTISDADGDTNFAATATYLWSGNGNPANQVNYVPVGSDQGTTITVTVAFTDDRGFLEDNLVSLPTAEIDPPDNNPATGSPSITPSGDDVGDTLTAGKGSITDPDGSDNYNATASYAWTNAAGSPKDQPVYTLVAGDAGNVITLTATFTDDLGNNETGLTNTHQMTADSPATGVPSITGVYESGEVLTANKNTISDPDGDTQFDSNATYFWNNSAGTPKTNKTYTLVDGDIGNQLTVTVAFHDDRGFHNQNLTSAATPVIQPRPNSPATGEPGITVNDELRVGDTLTADPGTIADDDGLTGAVYTYTWDGAGTAVSNPYTIVLGDVGNPLTVTASFTDDRGFSESRDSAPTGNILGNQAATGAPDILVGGDAIGDTLTGDVGSIGDPDGITNIAASIEYTWTGTASGVVVAPTYDLQEGDAGSLITLSATFNDDRGFSNTAPGTDTHTMPANQAPTAGPTITGTEQVGSTLTCNPNTIVDPDGTAGTPGYTYLWNGAGSPLTNSTYNLVAGDESNTITCDVTYTDDRGFQNTIGDTTGVIAPAPGGSNEWLHDFTGAALGAFTFVRNSHHTGYDDGNVIRRVTVADRPVYPYGTWDGSSFGAHAGCQGLLLEDTTTNLLEEDVPTTSGTSWQRTRMAIEVSPTSEPSIFMGEDATRLTPTTGNGTHILRGAIRTGSVPGQPYTFQWWVKKGVGMDYIQFTGHGGEFSTGTLLNLNLVTGAHEVETYGDDSARIRTADAGNGWWHVAITATPDGTATDAGYSIYAISTATAPRAEAWAPNGTDYYLIARCQIDTLTYPTSIIATDAVAPTTRAATKATAPFTAIPELADGGYSGDLCGQVVFRLPDEATSLPDMAVLSLRSGVTNNDGIHIYKWSNNWRIIANRGGTWGTECEIAAGTETTVDLRWRFSPSLGLTLWVNASGPISVAGETAALGANVTEAILNQRGVEDLAAAATYEKVRVVEPAQDNATIEGWT